ncbi:hypothetical protein Lesp02_59480 [Lentzea sp. NBRC 105346]|uniref:hypothetical protein n=1 Tax=Lentzea sp. NBRC 105346 TaxID=3032205 RepID=UPI0024A04BEC|nr:hypothetical protein [Lentzea sp. NBRC 105346]GLZ33760.1 hypothetical protein Lesp02_59480 [Lentzea sp. NBRC 105346]
MRATFSTILLSSLGSTVLWLLLVPHFSALAQSEGLVGLLGMERQVLGVLGALVVAVWADHGRVGAKFALLQSFQLVLAVVFLACLSFASPGFVLVWTGLRFFVVGASSVLAYRLLADGSSASRGAILQMVTSPQGAMVFAAVICAAMNSLVGALVFDVVSSVVVIWLLRGSFGGSLRFEWSNSIGGAARVFWIRELWPWNLLQVVFLTTLSGMMVYAAVIASGQRLLPASVVFPLAWFFYGLAFWVTAPLVRVRSDVFALLLVACGVAGAVSGSWTVHMGIYVVLTFVNAYWIHHTNAQILERAPVERLGQIRASMILYLGLVFGVGEQLAGLLLSAPWGLPAFGVFHCVGGVALILLARWCSSLSSSDARDRRDLAGLQRS